MISIIIPIAGSNHTDNLFSVIKFFQNQPFKDYEIILIEQIPEPTSIKLFKDTPYCKYSSICDKQHPYVNINWQKNVGVKKSNGEIFLFFDADIVFRHEYLTKVADFIKQKPWFVAWNSISYFNKNESNNIRKNLSICEIPRGSEKPSMVKAMGGAVCMTRDFYFKELHGLNESFCGWGGDDNDTGMRASKLAGFNVLPEERIYHLYHDFINKEFPKHIAGLHTNEIARQWNLTELYPDKITKLLDVENIGKEEGPLVFNVDQILNTVRKK